VAECGPRKVRPLKVEPLDEFGDGPLSLAMALASKLRKQGASEAMAATHGGQTFAVDPMVVAKALNWHGGLRTLSEWRGR
jgi:hypothetical protein